MNTVKRGPGVFGLKNILFISTGLLTTVVSVLQHLIQTVGCPKLLGKEKVLLRTISTVNCRGGNCYQLPYCYYMQFLQSLNFSSFDEKYFARLKFHDLEKFPFLRELNFVKLISVGA